MTETINQIKISLWTEISESLKCCPNIGDFETSLLLNDDIPRIIYKGKVVISDSLFQKFDEYKNRDSDLFQVCLESLLIAAGLRLHLNEKFSIIFSKCYSCIYFKRSDNDSSQFEQLYFSTKFINKFGVDYRWDNKDERLQNFIMDMYKKLWDWKNDSEKHKIDLKNFKKNL